jgi:uncharacterized protein YggE
MNMRNTRILLAASLIAWSWLATTVTPARAADAPPPPREITVAGEAEVKVVPDQVILTLAVETNDKDLLAAKAANDERVKKVLALATTFKIDPKHVQTDQISIEPRYRGNSNDVPIFIGYYVRKQIVICLKDTSRFEELLTAVLKAGTNSVPGIEFQSTELRKHRDEARSMAVKAAREKAEAMAGQLGQKIGRPLSISESSPSYYGGRGAYMAQNAMSNAGGGEAESDGGASGFAPGQISVKADVSIRFELQN